MKETREGDGRSMGEFAIFTEEVAMGLLARGFKLRGMGTGEYNVWYFEDSVSLERAVSELTAALEENYR